MLKRISRRFTSAHAIALLALFVALGGSAYAVNSINGAVLKRASVPGSKLKNRAVTSAKLAGNAVTGAKIANRTIRGTDLAAGAVGTANLGDAAVASGKVADAAISSGKLADGAVGTSKLAGAAVTGAKLAGDSVDGSKVADGSIGSGDLTPFSFTQPTLQNLWGSAATVGFGKDAAGFVHLRGWVLNGTLGTAAFELPAGQRPAQGVWFGALHVFGGNSTACGVTIGTGGGVIIGLPGDTGCAGTAGIYSLDGITFRAG
jgi:hypothetical protein